MASGAEILSYKGQAELALGSSDLPATSSVYVSDFDKSFQYWQNYAQRKFIADKAKWDQNNLERAANQKRLEDAINLGNYDIWDVDKDDFLNNYYNKMQEMATKDPTSVYDTNNPNYYKFNELLGRTKQAAAFSTQQKAEYDTQSKFEQLHPDEIRNLGASEQYKNAGSIMKRAEIGGINFDHNFELNLLADQEKLIKTLQYDNPTLEVTQGKYGNDLYTITQSPNLDNTRKIIEAEYDSGLNNQRAIQQMINDDPSIMDGFANPKDLYTTMRIAALPLDEKTKVELRGRNFPPQDSLTKPKLIVDYDTDNVTIASRTKAGKGGLKAVTVKIKAPDGTITEKYQVQDANGKVIETYTEKDDALNAVTMGKTESAQAIGGWDISKSGNAPSNILIRTPTQAYDLTTNRRLSTADLNTNAWNVDIVGVYDYYADQSGKIIPKQNVNSGNRNQYTPKRFAQVNRTFQASDGSTVNKTYLIPYDENIANPIQNMGIQLNSETITEIEDNPVTSPNESGVKWKK